MTAVPGHIDAAYSSTPLILYPPDRPLWTAANTRSQHRDLYVVPYWALAQELQQRKALA